MKAAEVNAIVSDLDARLARAGSSERARGAKAYMKSELEFHGVTQADVRTVARAILAEHEDLGREEIVAIARAAIRKTNFDLRSGAIALLERRAKLLEPSDLPALIDIVRRTACWAHVDWLATKVIALPLAKDPKAPAIIRGWAGDDDLWVRRTALLVQLDELRRGAGDLDLFIEIAEPMLEERQFWIRKAIGWVLREVSKKRPAPVRAFVQAHRERMSGVTRREAEKYI